MVPQLLLLHLQYKIDTDGLPAFVPFVLEQAEDEIKSLCDAVLVLQEDWQHQEEPVSEKVTHEYF